MKHRTDVHGSPTLSKKMLLLGVRQGIQLEAYISVIVILEHTPDIKNFTVPVVRLWLPSIERIVTFVIGERSTESRRDRRLHIAIPPRKVIRFQHSVGMNPMSTSAWSFVLDGRCSVDSERMRGVNYWGLCWWCFCWE